MTSKIKVEVVGYTYKPCGPFPCDADRSWGLDSCYQKEKLSFAFPALQEALSKKYGDLVSTELIELDTEIPTRIKEIIIQDRPPLPIILIDGKCVPIGMISLPKISQYIDSKLVNK